MEIIIRVIFAVIFSVGIMYLAFKLLRKIEEEPIPEEKDSEKKENEK